MGTRLNYLFNGTDGTTATLGNTGASLLSVAGSDTIKLANSAGAHSTTGLLFTGASGSTNTLCARFPLANPSTQMSATFLVKVPASTPAADFTLATIRHASGTILRIIWDAESAQLIAMDAAFTVVVGGAGAVLTGGTTYRISFTMTGGSATVGAYTIKLYTPTGTSPLATFGSTSANLTVNAASHIQLMDTSTSSVVVGFEDLQVEDGITTEIPQFDPNTAPTVALTPPQNVAASATAAVSATVTDDGTIASQAWSFLFPTSSPPTLTGGSTADATFTAPAAGFLGVLQFVATDDGGKSTTKTTEVRVPITGASWTTLAKAPEATVGTWNIQGGSATVGAALADSNDSTYVESGNVTGTEQAVRIRLQPSATRSSGTITLRLSTDSGAANCPIRLYEGNTLRQTWGPQAITATPTDYTFTVSAPTVAAIIDWGNLSIEIGATS